MQANPSKKILITGATGLVGSCLLKHVMEQDGMIIALYHHKKPVGEFPAHVQWQQADILDITTLEELFADTQQVYHCAAKVSFDPKDKHALYQTNVEGTKNVINAALNSSIEKLVYVSSVAALGRIREGILVHEKMQWSKETSNSVYGHAKYLAEMEVWRGIGEGLNACIVNPSIILGESDWTSGSTAIFKKAYEEFPWYSIGTTGVVDVRDLVRAMHLLMQSTVSGERFIISAENISYKDLLTYIATAFQKQPPTKKVTPFMAALIWRLEKIKAMLTHSKPLLTKETVHTAMTSIYYDNGKFLRQFPAFAYTPLPVTIQRICDYLRKEN